MGNIWEMNGAETRMGFNSRWPGSYLVNHLYAKGMAIETALCIASDGQPELWDTREIRAIVKCALNGERRGESHGPRWLRE